MKNLLDIHSIYNARYFSLNQIVETFIPSSQFKDAVKNNHSIIIGPRGCGKTTIFKMLTYAAQEMLKAKDIDKDYEIDFFAVYIPADRQWKKQQEKIKYLLKDKADPLLNFFLLSNTLISILNSAHELLNYSEIEFNDKIRIELAMSENIVKVIDADINGPYSFYSIKQFIYNQTLSLNENINKITFKKLEAGKLVYPKFSYTQLMDLCIPIREAIIEGAKKNSKVHDAVLKKWCFCYDELEISPKWISNEIIDTLFRSVDQNFIFKLTSTPIIEFNLYQNVNASKDDDYDIIECWNSNRRKITEWKKFCNEYLLKNFQIEKPSDLFDEFSLEKSIIESENKAFRKLPLDKSFEKGTVSNLVFKKLASFDDSFKSFLNDKSIDEKNPLPINRNQEDQIFRKIKPLVYSRFLFLKNKGKRTRKNVVNHFGFEYITELSEGNIRLFLSIITKFQEHLLAFEKIPLAKQSREIKESSNSFYLGIKNYTEGYVEGSKYSLFKLISILFEYFVDQIYGSQFKMDPKGTFYIDSKIDKKVQEVIKAGIINGHIIIKRSENKRYTPNILDDDFMNSILNKKLRLSYLLYPYFNLPKREYSKVNIRTIFHEINQPHQTNLKI